MIRLSFCHHAAIEVLEATTEITRADALLSLCESNVAVGSSGPILRRYEKANTVKIGDPTGLR